MNRTIFQTAEGMIISRVKCRMASANRVMKRAAALGYATLFAIEPNGEKSDYTGLLERDYLSKNKLSPKKFSL